MNPVAPIVHESATGLFRTAPGLGTWPHRGRVAAVGVGHAPTFRRWNHEAQTTVGALAIEAIRKAIADSGIPPEEVDGIAFTPDTSAGSVWPTDWSAPAG